MISWIWNFLIGGFLISHGLLHWRFDLSRSWLRAKFAPEAVVGS